MNGTATTALPMSDEAISRVDSASGSPTSTKSPEERGAGEHEADHGGQRGDRHGDRGRRRRRRRGGGGTRRSTRRQISPARRRRASGAGSTVRHDVRRTRNTTAAARTARASRMRAGEATNWMYCAEPQATTAQNVSTTSAALAVAPGHDERRVAEVLLPGHRRRPLRLGVRPGRPVVRTAVPLSPPPFEPDPSQRRVAVAVAVGQHHDRRVPRGSRAARCRRIRSPRTRRDPCRSPARSSWRGSAARSRRPDGGLHAAACRRASRPARRPRVGRSRRSTARWRSASATLRAGNSSCTNSQSLSCLLFQSL